MLIIVQKTFCQYTAYWTTGNEIGVVNYEFQQAFDTTKSWNTLAILTPQKLDSNIYNYGLPTQNSFYRVKANMLKNNKYFTGIKEVKIPVLGVLITNAILRNKILTWNATGEQDILFYSIEQTKDGVNYVETSRVTAGKGSYKITVK